MAREEGSHSEMAHARWSDCINVIFDQDSASSSRSRSRSSGGSNHSPESDRYRAPRHRRRHYRSSSSSSSSSSRSRSTSRTRSRSRPRCNRPSSRCRCDNHHRYHWVNHRRSPPCRVRAHSRSFSPSPSPDRYSHRRYNRSHSRSNNRSRRHRRTASRFERKVSRSPASSYRSHSRSGSSRSSLSLNLEGKQMVLTTEKTSAQVLGVESLQLPESDKPILLEQFESRQLSPKPETWVRQDPEKTSSQSHQVESEDISNPKTAPKKKEISFSINNSVAKPIVAAPSTAKVTSRVDSFGRRKPYGHWVPVKSGH